MTVSRKTHQIIVNNFPLDCSEGDNLLDTLNANNISISQSCGGFATCTTCRVFVLNGLENCGPRTDIENERAEERGFLINERLACQLEILGPIEVEILNPIEED
ncbi:MAG: 2Fe-2S iron-sulfur cluster-binding protein [Pseudobdellovibrio sp.]